ncbi:LOW QUALITY PROTEIN: hypothetical protein V2J09_011415 [Rumex salicifolius]
MTRRKKLLILCMMRHVLTAIFHSLLGIGGMGKSALAQLLYNDSKTCGGFQQRSPWQDLSVYGRPGTISRIIIERFLLVLDYLWDEDVGRGSKLWSILSSEIIITTRHLSIAKAMRADKTLELKGLSRDAWWALFRRIKRTTQPGLALKIVSKCVNVPLAIKSIASLFRVNDTIGEWKSLENKQLSKIESSDNPIMSRLRDSVIDKQDLIYLWIAQGYIKSKKDETLDMTGHSYFMELLRRLFFQDALMDEFEKGIVSGKMHDLVHDLAQDVAGEESCIITLKEMNQSHNKIRHISVAYKIDDKSKSNPLLLLDADRIRSSLFMCTHHCSSQLVDGQVTKFRFLRALSLEEQLMESVPSSIGEYLNLSGNKLTHLPNSITKLVNLITLDVSGCDNLVKLPKDIRKLVSLRHLINHECYDLVCMPPTLGKLTSLEHLSEFKVSKSGDGKYYGLDALARLNLLRGSLMIEYDTSDVLFECEQISGTLETLWIKHYSSIRMPC